MKNYLPFARTVALLLLVAVLSTSNLVLAQHAELGPKCGKTFISQPGPGAYWADPNNARCDDDESRSSTAPLTQNQFSQALVITNFGFKVPAEARIEGIEVVLIRKADVSGSIHDKRIVLLKGNQSVGTSLHTSDLWDSEWTAAYYGDGREDWETNWKVADVNSPEFGVSIEVACSGAIARPQIDEVLVTIHYSIGSESAGGPRTNIQRLTCSPVGS